MGPQAPGCFEAHVGYGLPATLLPMVRALTKMSTWGTDGAIMRGMMELAHNRSELRESFL